MLFTYAHFSVTHFLQGNKIVHNYSPDSDRPASGETKSYCICSDFKSLPTYAAAAAT